jgi:hypothetical protein
LLCYVQNSAISKNVEIEVQFSRKRIKVNSASCKRTSDCRFEILKQFATEKLKDFLIALVERYQFDFKVGQKKTGKFLRASDRYPSVLP